MLATAQSSDPVFINHGLVVTPGPGCVRVPLPRQDSNFVFQDLDLDKSQTKNPGTWTFPPSPCFRPVNQTC